MLSDSRLLLMALKLSIFEESVTETAAAVRRAGFKWVRALVSIVIEDAALPDPCAWNILLRRRQVLSCNAGRDMFVPVRLVGLEFGSSVGRFSPALHRGCY